MPDPITDAGEALPEIVVEGTTPPLPPPRSTDLAAPVEPAGTPSAQTLTPIAPSLGGDRQYKRSCSLVISDSKGGGIDVSQLRIRFRISQGDRFTRNHANIWVTNLKKETMDRVPKENASVSLRAGYEGNTGLIFSGETIQRRIGRENPVDTYLNLIAVDGGKAHDFGVVKKTLAAGHTFRDQVDAVLEAFKPLGVTAGFIADLGSQKLPRAATLFGMGRDILRDIGFSTNTSWSIQNGKLQILKTSSTLSGEAIVLNSRTGLIGLPTQTYDGVEARCLLNPKIKPGTRVKIDQSSIQTTTFNTAWGSEANNAMAPSLAEDGFYKVWLVDHVGDTRGGPWYSELICNKAAPGPNDILPIGLTNRGVVNPDDIGAKS